MRKTILLGLLTLISLTQTLCAQNIDSSLFKDIRAREIGPTAFGGRIVDIEVNPQNPFHIFAASGSGGLWVTENNGVTWNCIFDKEQTVSIGDIALDPRDANTIWVGTGEANNQRSSYWGDGIYKSVDGGKTWVNKGLTESHHIGRIVIDPTDSNIVYVAALGHLYTENEERGLYKTTDGGESWTNVLYINPMVGVVDVVMDPSNPQILYAATYERIRRAWNLVESGPGSAIYKTLDGGATWSRLSGGLPQGNIGRIGLTIYPQNPNILYCEVSNFNLTGEPVDTATDAVADDDQDEDSWSDADEFPGEPRFDIAQSQDEESATQDSNLDEQGKPQDGEPQAKSQDDAQQQEEQPQETPTTAPETVVSTPFGFDIVDDGNSLVVRNVNRDQAPRGLRDGQSIKRLGGLAATNRSAVLNLAASLQPTDQLTIVVVSGDQEQTIALRVQTETQRAAARARIVGGEIYRTDNGGETWTKMNRRAVGGSPPYYYGQIRIDPNDDQRVYVLSIPLYVSRDGGRNWTTDGASSVHVDHHALWINPQNSNHLILGNDGGFHISYDRGRTWDHVAILPLAQFYAITADMQRPYHVYGGTQDNGTWGGPSRSRRGAGVSSLEWYRIGGGDGFYVQVDPHDPDIIFAESQFGMIFRLNRRTGQRASIRPPQSEPREVRDRFNWNSPILMSTHDPRVIYFAGNKLFKSMNRGDHWEVISPDLTTANPERISGNVPYCTITAIAESPLDPNLLMVGTDDGNLQLTKDGGKTWTNLVDRLPFRPQEWWCSRVVLSHHNKDVAYASFTGYREDDFRPFVFKTTDAGESWEAIIDGLPQAPVNVIREDHRNKNLLFVGTEFSVFTSLDQGLTWSEINTGLTRVAVHDLMIHPRDSDLIVGTHGRGIFIFDDISPLQEFASVATDQAVTLLKPRTASFYPTDPLREVADLSGNRRFTASNPPPGARVWYYVNGELATDLKIKLRVKDLLGKEILAVDVANTPGLNFHTINYGTPGGQGGRQGQGGRPGGGQARAPSLQPGTYLIELVTDQGTQTVPLVIESVAP
ncbi:MAG TPA: hypothetical protein PKD64_01075 [Pirellulaceae bacterium]|nr:hypothetical protein [Pirellulaceae bacterium]HMO90762.1 hypothetical protein [Pirellulaceae bacterium]HMP68013.1 hypothetical protein [Pirellulaceae bacterium]